jgi:thioredoxin reductase (NADPH)
MAIRNVIIIGSGPAGLTAALYTARANLQPLLIEGLEAGGQLMLTTMVENFPGHKDGILGPELMGQMRAQAERFGAEMIQDQVLSVDLCSTPMSVKTSSNEYTALTVIIATGASARMLGLPSERALMGHGVSTCATCDGYFFRGHEIAVVGGGDSAMEEASYLTKFASTVYLVHRRDEFRASKIMAERVLENPKITVKWSSAVDEVLGDDQSGVTGIKLRNLKTNEVQPLEATGMFCAIGHTPNTDFLNGQVKIDDMGYIVWTEMFRTCTSVEGVFAAGGRRRQLLSAGDHVGGNGMHGGPRRRTLAGRQGNSLNGERETASVRRTSFEVGDTNLTQSTFAPSDMRNESC